MNLNCWESSGYNKMPMILTMISPTEVSVSKDYSIIESNSDLLPESFLLMLASEEVLSKEWGTPEEDEAWENL